MNLNTNQKGDIAELRIAARLIEKGFTVLFPFGDNARYDLVFDKGEQFLKVQCKSGIIKDGVIQFHSSSSTRRTTKGNIYTDVEYFGVYCRENDTCYLVPVDHVPSTIASLRIKPTKSNQKKGIRYADMYQF